MATEAPSAHSGGVTVFYRVTEQFSVEALQTYGANVVRFQLETGDSWWFILGCDLAPYNASTINDIFAAISKRPPGGRAAGGRQFQHQTGRTGGPGSGRGDCIVLESVGINSS